MPEPTAPERVTVDATALSALVDIAYRCVELHAQVEMDTPEAKAQHARAVDAMRESLAAARSALDIRALVDDLLGADPDYLGVASPWTTTSGRPAVTTEPAPERTPPPGLQDFAADVLSLVEDYSDHERDIIARLPFLATFDQVCFEKYGIVTDKATAERTPQDDTTESLRERLRETARAAFASRKLSDGSYAIYSDRNPWRALDDAVDAILAALAGDPGDLPARMADAIRDANGTPEALAWWQQHPQLIPAHVYAAAAMSVRWEDHARTKAEMERLQKELAEANAMAANACEDCRQRREEAEAERDALKAAMAGDRREEIERIQAERDAMPDDERIRREAADAPLLRIQLAHADDLKAERDALKAAEKRVRTIAEQWIAQAADNDQDELVPVLANVGRTILAALAAPESHEDAEESGEAQPGTYWERAVLERFVTGGPVEMATVRQQVAALLAEIPTLDAPTGRED